MSKLMSLKINVNKITKSKLYKGEKGTYLDLTVALNDKPNDFGQDVSCWQEQTKEEREQNTDKNFLGNGKVFWSSKPDNGQAFETTTDVKEETNDLPF